MSDESPDDMRNIVRFTCHGNSAPAYSCDKPGDMTGEYVRAEQAKPTPLDTNVGSKVQITGNAGEMSQDKAIQSIERLTKEVHQIAVEHGWWDEERNDAECIALMHSELSEALEAMRHGRPMDEHCPEHDSVTVELADCIIRIMDFSGARNLDLAGALIAKIGYNRGRPYKHGNKRF